MEFGYTDQRTRLCRKGSGRDQKLQAGQSRRGRPGKPRRDSPKHASGTASKALAPEPDMRPERRAPPAGHCPGSQEQEAAAVATVDAGEAAALGPIRSLWPEQGQSPPWFFTVVCLPVGAASVHMNSLRGTLHGVRAVNPPPAEERPLESAAQSTMGARGWKVGTEACLPAPSSADLRV